MQTVHVDLLSNPGEFEIFLLPTTLYQKKNGAVPVMKGGLFEKIVEKAPKLPHDIGKAIEKYGNCPAILHHIPGTKYPTKFATFPMSPTALRAENPDDHVFHRLRGRFKPFSLLPGWTLLPRSDMIEFSCIKLQSIMKYYKLSKVALPFEMFTFGEGDEKDAQRIGNIIESIITQGLSIIVNQAPSQHVYNTVTESSFQKDE